MTRQNDCDGSEREPCASGSAWQQESFDLKPDTGKPHVEKPSRPNLGFTVRRNFKDSISRQLIRANDGESRRLDSASRNASASAVPSKLVMGVRHHRAEKLRTRRMDFGR
jgi:hypothetical protein